MRRLGSRPALAALVVAVALLATASPALAAPQWEINSLSNTTAEAGGEVNYVVQIGNSGDQNTTGAFSVRASLPVGLSGISGWPDGSLGYSCTIAVQEIACDNDGSLVAEKFGNVASSKELVFTAAVGPGLDGQLLRPSFEVSGGGAADAATAVDPTRIGPPAAFGVDAFDGLLSDAAGAPFTRAAGHPAEVRTYLDFNTRTDPNNPFVEAGHPGVADLFTSEAPRDVLANLPLGLVGAAGGISRCELGQLVEAKGEGEQIFTIALCNPNSQVGTFRLKLFQHTDGTGPYSGIGSVYNMVPPPGVPARFAFEFAGTVIPLDARLRSDGSYGLAIDSRYISQAAAVSGVKLDFWGVPGDQSHDALRHCPGQNDPSDGGGSCAAFSGALPFLRTPSTCTEPGEGLRFALKMDSWQHPGAVDASGEALAGDPAWKSASYQTHEAPGYPYPPEEWGPRLGTTNCAAVPFEPRFSAQPTTATADSPSGLEVDLEVPQDCWAEGEAESICPSDLRDVSLALPAGMSVNPSSAGGRQACSAEQVGYVAGSSSPFRFSPGPQHCPDASKIGEVAVESPLLGTYQSDESTPLLDGEGNVVPRPLHGSVYLAAQADNPFQSLLAIYLVVEDAESGVTLKLPGRVVANPRTGQLETFFDENPQLPFSRFHVELFGGPRAALRTPSACGTYATTGELTPWSGNPAVSVSSSFQVTQGCGGGFDPKLTAGTQNPLAGTFSPFSLRLTREDGTQEIGALSATLPKGLIGKPAGIPYCPDATLAAISGELGTGNAQIASPGCPAASLLGTVIGGAGAGPNPFYATTGRAYWAGPYKGAPLSLAVVAPAVAGPFDLGNVVVRNALRIDPETAQVTAVSDPLPSILHGIPLDLRDIRVNLDRNEFTLNPTSCEPKSIDASLTSVQGLTVQRSQRFQAAGCDRLGFKPKLALRLSGPTNRGAHPALKAVLRMPPGGANIRRLSVALPGTELLENAHIRTICTRVQFAAGGGGGEQCPAGSVYGHVRATSPLVDYPLEGPVFLRSSSHELPDLVATVRGPASQPIVVAAVGRIDTAKGGRIRSTFETFPDAPITKAVLTMQGKKKGLLVNSTNICKAKPHATALFDAQNGAVRDLQPLLKANCGDKAAGRRRR